MLPLPSEEGRGSEETLPLALNPQAHLNQIKLLDPREGNDNPLQYSCLENPMDGGAW